MTTAPRISGTRTRPSPSSHLSAPLRSGLVAVAAVTLGATALAAVLVGSGGVVGALVGGALVAVFFGLGALVLGAVTQLAPGLSLLVALLTYTLKVVLLAAVFVGLQGAGLLDRGSGGGLDAAWLGGTVIAGTLVWLVVQLRSSLTARIPVYELPEERSEGTATGGRADAS